MRELIEWIGKQPQQVITILAALISGLFAIIATLFAIILWPLLKGSGEKMWDTLKGLVTRRTFENSYLDWLVKEHQFLPILPTTLVPVTDRHSQELDTLYVSLTLTSENETKKEVTLGAALGKSRKLVILGDPGAGKTTILRFLALTFARARRGCSPYREELSSVESKRSVAAARRRLKNELNFPDRPLPVFVYLNRLRDVDDWAKDKSLLDALRDEFRSVDSLREFPAALFEKKLRRGECVFLFDAFDELGSQNAREAISRKIGELTSSVPAGNRFILTSRIVGYTGQLGSYGFETITVERLSWGLIEQLVKKWYDSLKEPALATQLLDTLKVNVRIYELAVNPMLLSLIVLVQYVKRLIPDRRHILYDECVKILVERRFAPPSVQEEYNQVVPGDEVITILRALAEFLHKRHLREVSRYELEHSVLPEILKSMPTSRASAISCSKILSNIEQRSQLLIERGLSEDGAPLMAFSHLTFQEYLVSTSMKEQISTRGEHVTSLDLLRLYETDAEWWEEVALLYAAQLSGTGQQSFLNRLFPEQNNAASNS